VQRLATLDAAFALADSRIREVWAVEADDVRLARALARRYPALRALHLACCKRRGVTEIKTFDRALGAAAARA